jgi:hypothetical protein
MERFYGCLPTRPDPRDYRLMAPRQYTGQFVDLSEEVVQIYDQLQLGSCVSNGWALAIDHVLNVRGLDPYSPSRLFIYYQGRVRGKYPLNQDTGLEIRDGVDVVVSDGAPPESDWAYDIDKFAQKPPQQAYVDALDRQALKYASVDPSQLDDAIASGYIVVSGFPVFESFESTIVDDSGILPMPKSGEQELGGHCTVYVSTIKDGAEIGGIPGVKYRKKANSWGIHWGLSGYYWEPVQYAQRYESDFWVITEMEDPHVGPPPPPDPVDADEEFAAVLKPWASKRHSGGAKVVASAGRRWLTTKKL